MSISNIAGAFITYWEIKMFLNLKVEYQTKWSLELAENELIQCNLDIRTKKRVNWVTKTSVERQRICTTGAIGSLIFFHKTDCIVKVSGNRVLNMTTDTNCYKKEWFYYWKKRTNRRKMFVPTQTPVYTSCKKGREILQKKSEQMDKYHLKLNF